MKDRSHTWFNQEVDYDVDIVPNKVHGMQTNKPEQDLARLECSWVKMKFGRENPTYGQGLLTRTLPTSILTDRNQDPFFRSTIHHGGVLTQHQFCPFTWVSHGPKSSKIQPILHQMHLMPSNLYNGLTWYQIRKLTYCLAQTCISSQI